MSPVSFLLVDDLDENLLSLEALLRRDGLEILKARSGDQALETLLRHDVALALIDVQMPGLNGFELAELMRGNERTRRVPIIFVTAGSVDSQRRFRGYEAGAVDFIHKPIEPDILRSKADVFFELSRQRQQIATQRDELRIHTQALEEADRRKDEFLATLAHELRNPLAPLRHGIDILRRNPDDKTTADVRDMMDRQLGYLVRLVDDLLDVSRVSRGKIDLRIEELRVADIVRASVEASRPLIDAARHTLTVELPSEPLWVAGDLTRLAQVVGNLLNNAAKYTPEGGDIRLAVRPEGEAVLIRVSDSGIGIPADKRTEVFELFTQLEDRLDRTRGGLGIGLALVKRLVAMHGGTVDADSPGAGKGSVFSVRLPAVENPTRRLEQSRATRQFSARPLRVLVVDDNADVAQTLGWMLETIGHDYHIVHDGRQALLAAKDFGPDVVILDIGLPGMDGYAVCREFRRDQAFKNLPIIAQTGWGQDRDKVRSSDAGFDHHLVKPAALEDFERLLADLATARSPAEIRGM
jgi:signal transduction histidine kinase